jgi:hypothetical protein
MLISAIKSLHFKQGWGKIVIFSTRQALPPPAKGKYDE